MRALGLCLLLAAAAAAQEPEAALERAMSAELGRAMTELKGDGYRPAYYVSLTASDLSLFDQKCSMGAFRAGGSFEQRLITPDVRVGDHGLDNHPVSGGGAFLGRSVSLDDDEFALRHSLWRLLDGAYKAASADFLRKQALRVRRGKTEYDFDDLSREAPRVRPGVQPPPPWSGEVLRGLCLEASREFRGEPSLLHVDVGVKMQRQWSRLRDSEGSHVDFGRDTAEIELEAVAISTDGLRLSAARRMLAAGGARLPTTGEVRAAALDMLSDLRALSAASSTSPFSAPALLDPSVSAAVVLAIGTRLTGEEQRNPNGAQIFRDKMGKAVLPEEFTLEDDPTLPDYKGQALSGSYDYDDQGVPARAVTLIERGLLKGLLLSRYPVIGFPLSNGHARGNPGTLPGATPGVLILRSQAPVPEAKLLLALREECRKRGKPYGLWVRKLRSWSQQQSTGSQGSIRLMGMIYMVEAKTGKLTLVRDLDVVGTPLTLMGNIISGGGDSRLTNLSNGVPTSVVVPSLLFKDIELQRSETKPEKLPILPPPSVAAQRKSPPFVPRVPFIQVVRYVLRARAQPVPDFVMQGLLGMRQHQEGPDLVIDAKLSGPNMGLTGDAVRLMDRSIERLAAGGKVDRSILVPAVTQASYRSQYGEGWPDAPR